MVINKELQAVTIKKIAPKKVNSMLKDNINVIDVRPIGYKKLTSFIKETNYRLALICFNQDYLKIPKDKPILLVDPFMRQATVAAKFLKLNGFNILGVLKGGIKRWKEEGLPVVENMKIKLISDCRNNK